MYRWITYAFVRIAFFYCTGVILGIECPNLLSIPTTLVALGGLATVFVVCVVVRRGKSLLAGALAALALISAGTLNVSLKDESRDANHLTHVTDSVSAFRVVVHSAAQERPRTTK